MCVCKNQELSVATWDVDVVTAGLESPPCAQAIVRARRPKRTKWWCGQPLPSCASSKKTTDECAQAIVRARRPKSNGA